MRSILALVLASAVFGSGAVGLFGANPQYAEQLLTGILQDIGGILQSFEGGPDDPRGPVANPSSLADDQSRLAAATRKANELATELQRIEDGVAGRDRR